jgi:peptidoglycan-N-acetylglucosamine deacetylase
MRSIIFSVLLLILSPILFAAKDTVRTLPVPGTVALTFDDGPSPIYTPQVLAILKKYSIKATFFVVGASAKKYPELLRQIVADGHAINNHSWSHPKLTKLSDAALHKEIVGTRDIIEEATGKKPACLRYPFGLSNEHVRQTIRNAGMVPVPMGFNSFDYENRGTDKLVRWVLQNVHSGQVILLHDGYNARAQTVAALPRIIEGIKEKGLGFSEICT